MLYIFNYSISSNTASNRVSRFLALRYDLTSCASSIDPTLHSFVLRANLSALMFLIAMFVSSQYILEVSGASEPLALDGGVYIG